MLLSIIIVNYNTKSLLKECLNSIYHEKNGLPVEIIVVDNNSADSSQEMVRADFPAVRLLSNDQNLGFGGANNQGIEIARGDYLLFINSDSLVIEGFFRNLFEAINKEGDFGILGFKILNPDGSLQPSCGNFPTIMNQLSETIYLDRLLKSSLKICYRMLSESSYRHPKKVDWVSGSCFLVKKEVIKRVGGFDGKYFLYIEEIDLSYRMKKSGYDTSYLPISAIKHINRSSTDTKIPAIIFSHLNLIYFFSKNYSRQKAEILKIIFILKCLVYLAVGYIAGIIAKSFREKARAYYFLLTLIVTPKKIKKYEDTFKQ